MIRALVAEDSATVRQLLVALLDADPDVQVVGEARDGIEAIGMTRDLRPDIVVMDVHMPRMGGFDATLHIMVDTPTPIVIVSSTLAVHEVEVSMQALRVGALSVLPKPRFPGDADGEQFARHFVDTVKALSQVKVVRRWRQAATDRPSGTPTAPATSRGPRPRVIAMAGSTGGPAALHRILNELPESFAAPILVVQHIAAGFVEGLAAWLDGGTPLRVTLGRNGERLAAGHVYLAPDSMNLEVDASGRIELSRPRADAPGFTPSADVLFRSVGRAYGRYALAVVLTGMGRDGVEGLEVLRAAGGRALAQDEASSVVFGMPKAAIDAGLVDAALPLKDMARYLEEAVALEGATDDDPSSHRRG